MITNKQTYNSKYKYNIFPLLLSPAIMITPLHRWCKCAWNKVKVTKRQMLVERELLW